MDRDRQLDDAEPGAEVAAGHRDRRDRLGAQLVGDLRASSATDRPLRSAGTAMRSSNGVFGRASVMRIPFPGPPLSRRQAFRARANCAARRRFAAAEP